MSILDGAEFISEYIIVGHGKSLQGKGRGSEIDQYPTVRLKTFTKFHNEKDYGKRINFVCSSTEVMHTTPKGAIEYWCYPKKGDWDKGREEKMKDRNYVICLEETEKWNVKFRELSGHKDGAYGRNVSTGLAAIIICAERQSPEKIILAGFDTLLDPSIPYESVYNPGTKACVNHLWQIEHDMLPEISEFYGVEIVPFE